MVVISPSVASAVGKCMLIVIDQKFRQMSTMNSIVEAGDGVSVDFAKNVYTMNNNSGSGQVRQGPLKDCGMWNVLLSTDAVVKSEKKGTEKVGISWRSYAFPKPKILRYLSQDICIMGIGCLHQERRTLPPPPGGQRQEYAFWRGI